jgi:RND family efflux transporter MFP subunit
MKRINRYLTLSLIAVAASACNPVEQTREAKQPETISVTVSSVTAAEIAERLEAGGVVAARESSTVSSRIVAPIATLAVRAGDRVRAGDVLASLDARNLTEQTRQVGAAALAAERSVTRANAEQTAAEAEHRLATAWQKRVATLHARNSSTDQERDEAEAHLAAAAAHLAGARAGVELADANLAAARAAIDVATATETFAVIRSPYDGVITERLADPGDLAAPGVPLVRIESGGAQQAVVRVDEARARYIHAGDRVTVLIDGGPATDEAGIEGVVAEVARAVAVDQRAFTVKINLPATVAARSGTFARAVFRGAPRRALVVPAAAVQRQGQVSSVYVVQNDVARLRLIQVGVSSPDGVEVLAGLDAGESVVTSPLARLFDGARVAAGVVPRAGRSS